MQQLFTNWKRGHATFAPFLGGGAFMKTLGLAFCGAVAAASLSLGAIGASHGAGALAIGTCGAYGYAVAARLGSAQNTALRQCYQYGGKDCVIRAWACDAKG